MRLLVTIQHGENVHLFKNAIDELVDDGHEVAVFGREKGVTGELLTGYGIDHTLLCSEPDTLVDLAATQIDYEWQLLKCARSFDPDVVLSSHGIAGPHVASVLGATSLNYVDTEAHIAAQHHLFTPFSDVIFTPESVRSDFGDRAVEYPGLHELAYLHPDRFRPDPAVLTRRGVDPDGTFFVVRLNAWDAHHDVGKSGFTNAAARRLIDELAQQGDVYVSDEGSGAATGSAASAIPVAPHEIHHLMYYADLFVGDVSTMTVESAVLGTPTVRVSPFATERDMGKFRLLEEEYGLIYSFHTSQTDQAIAVAKALATDSGAEAAFADRRRELVADTIDTTEHILAAVRRHDPTDRQTGSRRARKRVGAASTLAGWRL